jgi:iron complex outermembrane receptor protein
MILKKKPLTLAVKAALSVAATMSALPTMAQDNREPLEEVVVTGSRIQRANLVTSSPVQQLDAEQLSFSGVTRVEDVLASLPQISLDQSSGQAIESEGTATLQLRNLGVSRTLVLVDGKRLPINSPASIESGPDLNFIPMQLVKRVEILTGGASSTYGSDAVAGVVNFIMMDDFEGVKLDYQFSQNRHDNDGNKQATATAAANQNVPTDTANDGDISDLTLIMGGNLNEGRGNITVYGTYRNTDGVTQSSRDHATCAVRVTDTGGVACLGSGTSKPGNFYFENEGIGYENPFHVEGNDMVAGYGPLFNFAAPSYFQRPDERYTLGGMGHYELNEHVEAYTSLMFMDDRSDTQFGPAGVFFDDGMTFNCDNPLVSDQQRAVANCTGTEEVGVIFGRRNVEGGPRNADMHHSTYRGVFGLKGDINETWRYDMSYQYAEVSMDIRNGNYLDVAKANLALNAVDDGNGNIVCQDSAAEGCVPWNIWNTDGVTQDQVDYYTQQYFTTGTTDQEVWSGYVQGNLGDYGIKLPWAESGIAVVIGAEYREENLEYHPDDPSLLGVVGGLSAALVPVDGGYDVTEGYIEANVPMVEGKAWAQAITLDLGYRYSDYNSGETTDTYKFAGSWAINEQIKLRAGYQRAVRAPNIVDQFAPQQGSLFAMSGDPCGGVVNGLSASNYTFEQCARSGVGQTIWDAGGPTDSPASQYNTLIGGNTELSPEESDTYTIGFIFTPNFAQGLVLAVDYYDIEVKDAIESIEQETTLLQCIENNTFCDDISRTTNDSLWLGNAGPDAGISALSSNIGFFRVKGVDVEASYDLDMQSWGSMLFSTVFGYIDSWEREEYPGAGVVDCKGKYGGSCQLPTYEYRNRFTATWATPWDVTVNMNWRYIGEVDEAFNTDPANDINSVSYIDLAATWNVTDWGTLRAGVNNLFDEEPKYVSQGVTARENGNTYPGVYDPLGQYLFIGATVQF